MDAEVLVPGVVTSEVAIGHSPVFYVPAGVSDALPVAHIWGLSGGGGLAWKG